MHPVLAEALRAVRRDIGGVRKILDIVSLLELGRATPAVTPRPPRGGDGLPEPLGHQRGGAADEDGELVTA